MRDRSLVGLTLAALFAASAGDAAADPPTATVRLVPPDSLTVGDRAAAIAEVTFDPPNDLPLLLTPTSEGTAVDVARGRLLRIDADDPSAPTLRFRIPLVARTAGTAVLRARVSGFSCEQRCRPVEADAELVLRVERRAEQ